MPCCLATATRTIIRMPPTMMALSLQWSLWSSSDSGAVHVQRAVSEVAMGLNCTCKRPSCTPAPPPAQK
eukprot:6542710-Alexandrium_andersonii.AAC.1